MTFELTGFQLDATVDVIDALQEGFDRFERNGRLTAVSLAAPTGAGKTVIATAVIEKLLYGDDMTRPNPELSVLWITDDPSLNQQTRKKMLVASSDIKPRQLVTVDPAFDQKQFDPGKIYFVHIQQLGRGATNYTQTGDKRQYSLWDTISNTIAERGTDFLLVVDEAHRGAQPRNGRDRSITARVMDGAGGTLPPSPVVLGISATPGRFVDAISTAGQRTLVPVTVDAQAVRESGLLKDKIRIRHPRELQPGDYTLLEMAVGDLKTYTELWSEYSETEHEPEVMPVLVIQVKPAASDAELREILDALAEHWPDLSDRAVGHSFQEHSILNLGSRSVRYVAPQDIQDDPALRVVLFKEALSTGWDCPRAEVMLSFRSAQDPTYIAQLIGRMVRTPLARRVATNDVLNTVSLYLPNYDARQVGRVIEGLQAEESQISVRIEVDPVLCVRNQEVPSEVWDILASVPSYTRPSKHYRSEIARLNALATLLVGTELDNSAMNTARTHVVHTLEREAERLGQAVGEKASALQRLEYQTQTYSFGAQTIAVEQGFSILSRRNIEDLFRRASRALGDAAAKWYWNHLCDSGKDPDEAKLFVAALAEDPSVPAALESASKTLIDTWRNQHYSAIARLPDSKRSQFFSIWAQARAPEQITLLIPSQVTAADKRMVLQDNEQVLVDVSRYEKHIFADSDGTYPAQLSGWEVDVLASELSSGTLIGWYRNPTGGPAALGVPYNESGISRTMYPDFLFFHLVDGEIKVDIVDPHRPDSSDTGPKWSGLAQYGAHHGPNFRRIVAVIKDDSDRLLSLDLKNPDVQNVLGSATNQTDIQRIFAQYGGPY